MTIKELEAKYPGKLHENYTDFKPGDYVVRYAFATNKVIDMIVVEYVEKGTAWGHKNSLYRKLNKQEVSKVLGLYDKQLEHEQKALQAKNDIKGLFEVPTSTLLKIRPKEEEKKHN